MKRGRKQCLLVMGMHRSGTSALTGVLAFLGVTLPKTLMTAHDTNPKGFFESVSIVELNDALLREAGSSWSSWRAFESGGSGASEARIADCLKEEFDNAGQFVAKDPRICRLAAPWLSATRKAGFQPLVLIPYRHPSEVADSLKIRNRVPVADSVLLWLRHVLEAEFHTRAVPRTFVAMDDLLSDWRGCVARIATDLGVTWQVPPEQVGAQVDAFLDGRLKHHSADADSLVSHPVLKSWANITYFALQDLERGRNISTALANLDEVRSRMNEAEALFGLVVDSRDARIRALRKAVNGMQTAIDDHLKRLSDILEAIRTKDDAGDTDAVNTARASEMADLLRQTDDAMQDIRVKFTQIQKKTDVSARL